MADCDLNAEPTFVYHVAKVASIVTNAVFVRGTTVISGGMADVFTTRAITVTEDPAKMAEDNSNDKVVAVNICGVDHFGFRNRRMNYRVDKDCIADVVGSFSNLPTTLSSCSSKGTDVYGGVVVADYGDLSIYLVYFTAYGVMNYDPIFRSTDQIVCKKGI